ncbi:hypothetical protein IK110_03070 [Candidatus Saccharibacteria bacterium]|nr:hypothetical protein [Candidatus Saccharibacteria bacterium]
MKITRACLTMLICAIVVAQPAFAILPSDDIIDFYGQNGIYYYNPDGSQGDCSASATKLQGKDTAEKIWNFFYDKGFTDAQIAGILGNAKAETNLGPTRASNSNYWGLFQWGGGRKDSLFKKLKDAGLSQYTDQAYWASGADKNIPQADYDRILAIELEFAYSEESRDWKGEIKKQSTPEAAAEVFLTLFERAVNGESAIIYYQPFIGLKYQGAKKRRNYAREFFDKYSGHGVSTSQNAGYENGKDLTVIGDSITVGSTNAILEKFPELKRSDIDAFNGRQWSEGIKIAEKMKLKKNVIFALGTNSSYITAKDVEKAINTIGKDHNIIFVTNFDSNKPHRHDGNNELFTNVSKTYSNIMLADWRSAVSENTDKYMRDHLHPNEAGRKLFAQILYDAVNNNMNGNCSISGEFTRLVKEYAWPEHHNAPYTNRMTAYAQAVTTSQSEGRYVGGSVNGVPGIDCGGFVTILVQNSGIAKDYNDGKGGTTAQEAWVKAHNWTLLNKNSNTAIDTSILQPGDVAFSKGHTFIYVGEINGFDSVIASASYGNSTARAPMAGTENLIKGHGVYVRWYRNPQYSPNTTLNYSTMKGNN